MKERQFMHANNKIDRKVTVVISISVKIISLAVWWWMTVMILIVIMLRIDGIRAESQTILLEGGYCY